MNSYELSRKWFDYCFENTSKVKPIHTALFFFIIEHNNRLGWKKEFGLPRQMCMDAIGVKNNRTFTSAFKDLEDWKFIKVLERSKNQYSANIITLIGCVKNTPATTKALDKAMQKHTQKHIISIAPINKPINIETYKPNNNKEKIDEVYNLFVNEIKAGGFQSRVESLYMRLKLKEHSLTPLLKNFKLHIIEENRVHKDTNDFFINFKNWLNVQDRNQLLNNYKK